MLQRCVLVCAAIVGFGSALERPSSEAEARHRRCCCYGYQYGGYYGGWQGNYCQTAYVNPCYNQAYGQTYQQQTYYRGADGTWQTQTAPPPAAPAPMTDQGGTYNQGRTYNQAPAPADQGSSAPPPPAPVQ